MPPSIDNLQSYAIAFVVIGVVLSVGLNVLVGVQDSMTVTESVTAESAQPSTPFPTNVTVAKESESTFLSVQAGSETLVFYDDSAGTNTTLSESDYNGFYEDGKFELLNTSTTTDYNSSSDKIFLDYDAEMENTEARKGAGNAIEGLNTFTEWLPLIALVVVASIIIGLVSMFRNSGRGGSRGRA